MSRKYQHTMELLPQIQEMLESGMTQREVEAALGLTGYRPVHELLKRERKPVKTLQEYKYENKQPKMEVEWLQDFLTLTGKG